MTLDDEIDWKAIERCRTFSGRRTELRTLESLASSAIGPNSSSAQGLLAATYEYDFTFECGDIRVSLRQCLVADVVGATDKLDCLVGKESTRRDSLWTRF